ncbi:MAG: 23S rRNA (uracil(1939)-C(5))-methyltransferase RlmD [Lachnospiraceae bacterium]
MRKNDRIQLKITDLGANGEGVGRYNDYAFFVKNAVVGDEVSAVITRMNKGYGFAKTLEIIVPSEDRVTPPCPNASRCGGCQIMQLSYPAQLAFKQSKVKNNLERIGGQKDFVMRDIIGMDEDDTLHYRNKVQFPVGRKPDGTVVTGFYAGRTHYIVPTDNCPVSSKAANRATAVVRDFISRQGVSIYDEITGKGLVRHILIRTGTTTGQLMVCLVINGNRLTGAGGNVEKAFVQALTEKIPKINSICLNINKKNTNVILGSKIICLHGNDYIEDKIGELTFRISPLSFFQTNSMQARKLYDKALEYAGLTGEETVWDLYCGIGAISLFLAQRAKKVYGVEIVPAAIDNAACNARLNDITNAEFFCGPAEEVFAEAVRGGKAGANVVVVNPPRKGCDASLLEAIMEVAPAKIVYVSCDSATLARDVKILSEKYKLVEATPVDLFPHTVHVETVVLMSRVDK